MLLWVVKVKFIVVFFDIEVKFIKDEVFFVFFGIEVVIIKWFWDGGVGDVRIEGLLYE